MVFIQDDLGGSGSRNTTREREKDDVYASKGGVVITVKNVPDVPDGTSLSDKKKLQGAYGNYVVIMDDNGKYWQYCHLKSTGVTENSIVNAGDYLGTIGNTGNSKTPHLHINVFENKEAYEDSSKPAYNRTINPLTEIRDGGKWPCNTMVSGSHNEIYPGKWGGNLYGYPHEGLDCSGNFGDPNKPNDTGNLIIGWNEFEINVEIASQGYDMYETQLEYKNRLENQYNAKVGQESVRVDGIYKAWNETSKTDGFTTLTDAQIKAKKNAYMETYKTNLANEYTNLLVAQDNQIDRNYDALRATVTKELNENYAMCQVIKSIKDDVLNNDLNFDDVSKILTSRNVDQSFYSGNKMRPSKNEQLRETLFKLDTDLYERMLNDEENLLKVIRGEMTVESYANHIRNERLAAEQARLAKEAEDARLALEIEHAQIDAEIELARLAAEAEEERLAEEQRLAEEKAKAEEEAKKKAEEEAKQKEEEERKRKAEEEAKAKEEEERKRKEQQEADAEAEKDKEKQNTEGGNTSADDPKDEETETTTPTPEDEPPTTTTPVTTGNDNGGSGGSGPGNGGTPIAGGGEKIISGGGGKDGPELPENPDIWITSVGAPTLPDGFYVTRIAGLSSLNAAYEAAFEAGEIDMNFFDEVSNLRTVQSISLFAREELG